MFGLLSVFGLNCFLVSTEPCEPVTDSRVRSPHSDALRPVCFGNAVFTPVLKKEGKNTSEFHSSRLWKHSKSPGMSWRQILWLQSAILVKCCTLGCESVEHGDGVRIQNQLWGLVWRKVAGRWCAGCYLCNTLTLYHVCDMRTDGSFLFFSSSRTCCISCSQHGSIPQLDVHKWHFQHKLLLACWAAFILAHSSLILG